MNAIGYTVIPIVDQINDETLDQETQKRHIERYASEHGISIVRWINDNTNSDDRPGLDEIIYGENTDLPVDAVLIATSSVITDDIYTYFYYKMLMRKKDISRISVIENFGSFDDYARILEEFIAVIVEMEKQKHYEENDCRQESESPKGWILRWQGTYRI